MLSMNYSNHRKKDGPVGFLIHPAWDKSGVRWPMASSLSDYLRTCTVGESVDLNVTPVGERWRLEERRLGNVIERNWRMIGSLEEWKRVSLGGTGRESENIENINYVYESRDCANAYIVCM